MNTYEITITVVTEGNFRNMEADARWITGLLTSESPIYVQEAWVESIDRIADYDVRDPEPYEWPEQPDCTGLPAPREYMTWPEWDDLRLNDVMILDPDGFDRAAPDCMTRLYTLDEFLTKREHCTIMYSRHEEQPFDWEAQDRDEIADYLGDDYWTTPDFDNREGDPAFNGAFNKW